MTSYKICNASIDLKNTFYPTSRSFSCSKIENHKDNHQTQVFVIASGQEWRIEWSGGLSGVKLECNITKEWLAEQLKSIKPNITNNEIDEMFVEFYEVSHAFEDNLKKILVRDYFVDKIK